MEETNNLGAVSTQSYPVPQSVNTAIANEANVLNARLAARTSYEASCNSTALNTAVSAFTNAIGTIVNKVNTMTSAQYADATVQSDFNAAVNALVNSTGMCFGTTWPALSGLGAVTVNDVVNNAINQAKANVDQALANRHSAETGQPATTATSTPTKTITTTTTTSVPTHDATTMIAGLLAMGLAVVALVWMGAEAAKITKTK